MAFFDDALKNIGQAASNVGHFFGSLGAPVQKKKLMPGDPGYVAPNPAVAAPGQAPANPAIQTQKLVSPFAPSTGFTLPHFNAPPVKSPQEQELDQMTAANLPAAQKNVAQGQGVVGTIKDFFTGDNDKIATQNARNQAVSQYQDKHGYNDDPEVSKYIGNTVNMGKATGAGIKTQIDNTNNAIKTSSSIPVLSDFTTMGSAGADLFYKAIYDQQAEKDAHNNATQAILGMNDNDVAALPPEQQIRLRNLQKGLAVASPIFGALDVASLGSAGTALSALKTAAVTGGKEAVINAAKTGAKDVAKNALIAGAAAPIVSAPIGNYVNNGNVADFNGFDPSQIPKQSAQAALWSVLLPGAAKKQEAEDLVNAKAVAKNGVVDGAAEAAREAAAETHKITVQQPRDIPVSDGSPAPFDVPVTNNSTPKPTPTPIVEVGGDTPGVNQVKVPTDAELTSAKLAAQPASNPDTRLQGLVPGKLEDTTLYTKSEIDTERQALDDALANKEINKTQHKAANAELDGLTASDDTSNGRKINVQNVKSIPVEDQSTVATDLPETPGKVRVTTATDPTATKSAGIAAQSPVSLPAETQNVLDNPKQFNSRQVAAARNQRKLATQVAKAQEQTADALTRIQTASPASQSPEGLVSTGEFGKGRGGAYEKAHQATELQQGVHETANMSPGDVIKTARDNQATHGSFSDRDMRNVNALLSTKRITKDMPEYSQIKAILAESGTHDAQKLALRGGVKWRRTASSDQLLNQFESKVYRLSDDPTKIDSKLFDDVDAAYSKYTDNRDAATQAYNKFTESPTPENTKAYHAAQDAADAADKDTKMTEYKVATQALKGNKDVKQARELEKMAQSADMYQMDGIDASMLGGTGTFVRNAVNAGVGGLEEKMFGKLSARVAGKITGTPVGGGMGRGASEGFGQGVKNIVDASKARAAEAGKNPLEHLKNWATTGNQLGDSVIDAQTHANVLDHYTQDLKKQGFTGDELKNRAGVMARQDPAGVTESYQTAARVAAGLGSGITRNNKIETSVKNAISDGISGGKPNKYTEGIAKLVTRMTLGFPTAIGRSLGEGAKRFTLGAPTFLKAIAEKDPQARGMLIKEGIKQAGVGGAVIAPAFYALGASGAITGAYPTNKEEQAQWQREGKTENSVKIGNDYYQLPAYLGSWAVPGLFYASLGRNGGNFADAAADVAKIVPSLLPTDQLSNWQDVINGRTDFSKFMSQTAASTVRAVTPGGALLNQLAKSFDPTQNDTNSGTAMQNFIDKVAGGIPGLSNTLPDKTDAAGNVLTNPNPLALALGASSTTQNAGVQETQDLNKQTNDTVQSMADTGVFSDPNLKAVLTDDADKKTYNDILAGKQASPDDLKKLQDAMVKGVTATDDTSFLEKGQYDSNISALTIKRSLMAADPTTKPSDLAKIDTSIARGKVYAANQIPYDLISAYESTGVADWRDMGDSTSDNYDPDMYQQLYAVDDALKQAGVSYNKLSGTKNKYTAKSSGSGSKSFSTDFGTLKAGTGAPTVQAYQSLDQKSGSIPVIQVQRPNIVHKISSTG